MKHTFPLCLDVDQHALYWDHIRGNKTKWIFEAMADRYARETGKSAAYVLSAMKGARLRAARSSGEPSPGEIEAMRGMLETLKPKIEEVEL